MIEQWAMPAERYAAWYVGELYVDQYSEARVQFNQSWRYTAWQLHKYEMMAIVRTL